MSQPHIQFYVGDWRKDVAIQSLSYHHRGVWFELLLLMHCSEERGKLVLNGRPMTSSGLARLLGMTEGEAKDAIDVLVASGVASREATGAIVNRRMIREEKIRRKRVESGRVGGSKAQANREANPYQVPDNDNDIDSEGARERVREFARGEGMGERDADWFFFKCEGNGWTNAGKPIRDWKATIRTWWRAGYFPSQRLRSDRFGRDPIKPLDKSKIEVPERFKAWVAERYPDKREEAMRWQTWRDVPPNGLRDEWWKEEKSKLSVDI